MKNFVILLVLFLGYESIAQQPLITPQTESILFKKSYSQLQEPNDKFLKIPTDTRLIAIQNFDGYFLKTYSVNQKGETVATGFMPTAYFKPNNNLFIINGKSSIYNDSYNPYGARDFTSMLLLGTFNKFLGKLRFNQR